MTDNNDKIRSRLMALLPYPSRLKAFLGEVIERDPQSLAHVLRIREQPQLLSAVLDHLIEVDLHDMPSDLMEQITHLTRHPNPLVYAAAYGVLGSSGDIHYLPHLWHWVRTEPEGLWNVSSSLKLFPRTHDKELLELMEFILRQPDEEGQRLAIQELYLFWNTPSARALYVKAKKDFLLPSLMPFIEWLEEEFSEFGQFAPADSNT
jgi:hypothetical protein